MSAACAAAALNMRTLVERVGQIAKFGLCLARVQRDRAQRDAHRLDRDARLAVHHLAFEPFRRRTDRECQGTPGLNRRAVQAQDGEEVVYSYIQWPDKATQDAGWARTMAEDPEQSTPMPFDDKRMFCDGFRPILDTAAE